MLSLIYGSDTRTLRTFNLLINGVWFILLLLHITGSILSLDLPDTFEPKINNLVWLVLLCLITSIASFFSTDSRRNVWKFLSLLLGAMVQIIIAIKYFSSYPPVFEVMGVVCVMIALWFIGGAFYVRSINLGGNCAGSTN